jgi:CubicO group peptidase (beta-lactamase class C family)
MDSGASVIGRRAMLGGMAMAVGGAGLDAAARIDAAMAAGQLPFLHAVLAQQDGRTVLERYYTGEDEAWGQPLGRIAFGPAVLHDLRSVSKSVVGLLYGIALAAGKVPGPDTPLLEVFDYPDLAAEPARRALTVGHALSMTLGIEWNEDLPYTDPRNGEIAMENAPDRYRYVLSRPIERPPGVKWGYCGGATALLGHLIARGTGMALLDYARTALLGPLGITAAEWAAGTNGEAAAASGLRLTAPGLARIGQCVLADGEGVVPADWLKQSFTPRVPVDREIDYGWQWYRYNGSAGGSPWVGGFGNGGQRLYVLPARKLVVAIFCGKYNQRDQGTVPLRVFREIVTG